MDKSTTDTQSSSLTLKERMQNHWITIAALLVIATSGITWKIANEIIVEPRNYEIERLKRRLGELPPDIKTGFAVRAGTKKDVDEITILEATLEAGESALSIDSN